MPRKNARPAAKKRAIKLKAKVEQRRKFLKASAYLRNREPRHGDAARLASIALHCGLESIHINRGRY